MSMRFALPMLILYMTALILCDAATAAEYPNPKRFEWAIEAYEKLDAKKLPKPGGIVCVGSSSMRLWKTLEKDLAPLPVIQRGFGGSNMNDVLHFADRVILPYKPRAILLYEGDNDIASGVESTAIAETFNKLVAKLREELPKLRIYVISAKPSPRRWKLWPKYMETNKLLKAACDADPRMTYIDVASPMLGEDGKPKPDIFIIDKLHMNAKGYKLWKDAVRPVLIAGEKK
ncbi:MAG: GDSL-type esterase/lipase family protein [Pirellulales bacterium]|nr:GDSL-type esterase/lipase family protein [Pirellulales bacterium]